MTPLKSVTLQTQGSHGGGVKGLGCFFYGDVGILFSGFQISVRSDSVRFVIGNLSVLETAKRKH